MTEINKEQLKAVLGEVVSELVDAKLAPLSEKKAEGIGSFLDRSRREERRERKAGEGALGVARMVRAMAAAKGDPDRAARWAEKAYDDDLGDMVTKALAAGDFTAGAFFVPEYLSNDIIPLLRARNVVRAAGTPTVPMPNGTLTMPKQTSDITAAYVGENQNITKTEPVGGQIVMSAKKLAAIVPISNDLLDFDIGDTADRWVRDNLVRHLAGREDQAFIRDTGLSSTPKGMRYWAAAANVTASNGTSAANIEADFKDLIQDLEGNNVDMSNPVFFMAPRSKNHLITLRDANGNLIYPEMRAASPTIHTYPVFTTNNIPTNLGAGTNETEVYLANIPDMIIGEAGGLEISVDSSASYVEGGTLKSAFSLDQTAVRAILRHDFSVMYEEAVAVKTGVTWGA